MELKSEAARAFIECEVSTAELFTGLAINAREDTTRERHLRAARKACDAASHFLPQTDFNKSKRDDFNARLLTVRLKLASLDENPAQPVAGQLEF